MAVTSSLCMGFPCCVFEGVSVSWVLKDFVFPLSAIELVSAVCSFMVRKEKKKVNKWVQ